MKKNFALLPLCFAFSLPFNVLASNANSELSYVDEQSLTISFDYGNRTGVYSGGLKNGVPDGVGMFTTSNDDGQNWKYIGEWEDGHFNGIGTTIFDIGQVSVATYVNDYMNGKGLMVQSDSTIYTGEFKNGLRDGIGTLYWSNGVKYEGTFADNYINGTGTIYYLASGAYIEGTFTENIETGFVDGNGTYFFGKVSCPCTITNGDLQLDGLQSETDYSVSEIPHEKNMIVFQNIPWWSTKADVEKQLVADGAKIQSSVFEDSILRLSGINYTSIIGEEDRVDDGGISGRYSGIKVAGYVPSNTQACYIYNLNDDGSINKDKESAQFYFGWYTFEERDYADINAVYDDLSKKLQSLYGEGVIDESDDYFSTITWTDADNNQIRILLGGKNNEYGYVTLGYMAAGANEKLDEMQIAVDEEAVRQEAVEREKNAQNVSGL